MTSDPGRAARPPGGGVIATKVKMAPSWLTGARTGTGGGALRTGHVREVVTERCLGLVPPNFKTAGGRWTFFCGAFASRLPMHVLSAPKPLKKRLCRDIHGQNSCKTLKAAKQVLKPVANLTSNQRHCAKASHLRMLFHHHDPEQLIKLIDESFMKSNYRKLYHLLGA